MPQNRPRQVISSNHRHPLKPLAYPQTNAWFIQSWRNRYLPLATSGYRRGLFSLNPKIEHFIYPIENYSIRPI